MIYRLEESESHGELLLSFAMTITIDDVTIANMGVQERARTKIEITNLLCQFRDGWRNDESIGPAHEKHEFDHGSVEVSRQEADRLLATGWLPGESINQARKRLGYPPMESMSDNQAETKAPVAFREFT